MKEGLLFDRVQMDGTGVPVNEAVIVPVPVFTDPAETPLSPGNPAAPWTEVAPDLATSESGEIWRELCPDEALLESLRSGDCRKNAAC